MITQSSNFSGGKSYIEYLERLASTQYKEFYFVTQSIYSEISSRKKDTPLGNDGKITEIDKYQILVSDPENFEDDKIMLFSNDLLTMPGTNNDSWRKQNVKVPKEFQIKNRFDFPIDYSNNFSMARNAKTPEPFTVT